MILPRSLTKLLWALIMSMSVLVFMGETGCSKKLPKYPQDHARFQRVVHAINTLENAYVTKDASSFHGLLLPLENLDLLEAQVRKDFDTFSTIHLDMTIDRVIIDGDRISAYVSWQGYWQRLSEGPLTQARGHGALLWSGKQVILLRGTEGDLPFGISRRPGFSS